MKVVNVTPEKAKELIKLGRNNTMFPHKVTKYKNMMLSGEWKDGLGDPLIIKNNVLLDGRHRLTAIIESGLTFNMPCWML